MAKVTGRQSLAVTCQDFQYSSLFHRVLFASRSLGHGGSSITCLFPKLHKLGRGSESSSTISLKLTHKDHTHTHTDTGGCSVGKHSLGVHAQGPESGCSGTM